MKIAIIGRGSSAIISALVCIKYGYEIDIYFDSQKPFLMVGESTTPVIGQLIYDILKITIGDLVDENIVSYKSGVKFVNWGVGNTFNHHFQHNQSAFHFETKFFNDYVHKILKSMGVKYYDYEVNDYEVMKDKVVILEQIYDFVIECSGWSEKDEYIKPVLETVNSAVLFSENKIEDYIHTLHIATEDGWKFGLPFPNKNVTKYGYLYNNKYSDLNTLDEKFKDVKSKSITWSPKYSRNLIQSMHNAYNGNRLFFIEPLQALSLHYYFVFAHKICDFLQEKTLLKLTGANNDYSYMMLEYQASLAFHYQKGSIFKSDFWKKIEEKSNIILSCFSTNSNLKTFVDNFIFDTRYQTNFCNVGIFSHYDLKTIYCGLHGKSIEDLIAKK